MTPSKLARLPFALVAVAVGLTAVLAGQDEPAPPAPVIFTADVDAVIHPVSAEFMIQTMDAADEAGATLVIFRL